MKRSKIDARQLRREIAAARRCPICAAPVVARGLCSRHYERLLRRGTTVDRRRDRRPLVVRFWSCVRIRRPSECWPWRGKKDRSGYARIKFRDGSKTLTHRLAYVLTHGPIPELSQGKQGPIVMHTCDNPVCCNPAHLRLGTYSDNSRDMIAKGRGRWGPNRPSLKR